jgi:peroxiredoxin
MPAMQRLYAMVPKDAFKMLAVLENDDPARAESFAAKAGITMPILVDRDKKVWPTYGLTGVPETFIVDKQGIIREKFIGPAQWDSPRYLQILGKYLNQK